MRILPTVLSLMIALAIWSPSTSNAQDADRQKAVIELLEATGMQDLAKQIIGAMSSQVSSSIKAKAPNLPENAVTIISEEITSGLQSKSHFLVARIALLYEKYFTAEEMRAITAYHKTPAGKKALKVMPQLAQESVTLGQNWAAASMPEIMENVLRRLQEAGYKL